MGKVIVVGIGPGSYEDMTIRADRALQSCDAIVGYGVYVDLVKERYSDKEFYATPMTQETKRCALALDLARAGRTAAMVCSGDSGIYGMAALVYELRGESEEPEIEVVPGICPKTGAAACGVGRAAGISQESGFPLDVPVPGEGGPTDHARRGEKAASDDTGAGRLQACQIP